MTRAMKDGSVVDGLRLTMTGTLTSDRIVDYQRLVRDCNSKSNNAKSLAVALYNKWLKLGSTDKDLICIYKAMSLAALSTYELECLTRKRSVMTEQGYSLEDCLHDATKCVPKRSYINPHPDAFYYDSSTEMLTIAGERNCKVYMHPKGVVAFMNSISAIKDNVWSPSCDNIENKAAALRKQLIQENYTILEGPIDCEVWGVFNNDFENLLMLEIIYTYIGARHINVALDLSKF